MMSDEMQFPLEHMREKAQALHKDTASLVEITSTHVQQMQEHHTSLPSSMQGSFGDFISTMQKHLNNGLDLRQQMSTLLASAANVAEESDGGIAKGFQADKAQP